MTPGPTRFAVARVDDIESAFQLYISKPIEKIILDKTTLVSYYPKRNKNVLVMSTMHKDESLSTREDMKQQIILDYNSNWLQQLS